MSISDEVNQRFRLFLPRFSMRWVKKHLVYGIILIVVVFFGFSLIFGNRGILAHHRIKSEIAEARSYQARLAAMTATIQHQIDLLGPKKRDSDMLEERVRSQLGYGKPRELVIMLQRNETPLPR